MANTQAVCTSFKQDLFNGLHAFGTSVVRGATTADTFKAALYLSSATVNATTTAYSSTNEVSGTNYTAGGVTVTNATAPTTSGTTAFWTPSASISWTTVTLATAFNCLLLYNNTASGHNSCAVYTFGDQTVTAGNFTVTMPTNDASNALLRLS